MWKTLFGFGLFMLTVAGIAQSQNEKQPFTITLKAETPRVIVGGQVILDVIMTNISDHEIACDFYYHDSIDQNYLYDVIYEDGKPAAKIIRKAPSNTDSCILEPGESKQSGGVISQIFDFRRPGNYTIQVSRPIWGDDQRRESIGKVQNDRPMVKSNIITITVLPVDAPSSTLVNTWANQSKTFVAQMYLMWYPNIESTDVPVPIGYETWGFSGSASQDITGTWSAITNGTPGPIGGFVPSSGDQTTDGYTTLQYGYPIWSGGPSGCEQ